MTMHGDAANAKACAKVLVREWPDGAGQISAHPTADLSSCQTCGWRSAT